MADTFNSGIIAWDTPGDYSGAFQSVDFRFTAAGTYDFRTGSSFTGTTNIHNASGGAVTVRLPLGTSYTTSGSPTPTVELSAPATLTLSNLVAGSAVLIRRTDTQEVLLNTIAAGATLDYPYTYTAPAPIEVIVRKASAAPFYQEWRGVLILSATSFTQSVNQISDE
jgi:hypothetical protein